VSLTPVRLRRFGLRLDLPLAVADEWDALARLADPVCFEGVRADHHVDVRFRAIDAVAPAAERNRPGLREAGAERDVGRRVLVEQAVVIDEAGLADPRGLVDERDLAQPVGIRDRSEIARQPVAI